MDPSSPPSSQVDEGKELRIIDLASRIAKVSFAIERFDRQVPGLKERVAAYAAEHPGAGLLAAQREMRLMEKRKRAEALLLSLLHELRAAFGLFENVGAVLDGAASGVVDAQG